MSDRMPGLGNSVNQNPTVELEKLHMAVLNMAETLHSMKVPIDDLYEKVITGNGQSPLLTRVSITENALKDISTTQKACSAPLRIYEIQDRIKDLENKFRIDQAHIENQLDNIVKDLSVITDDDLFRRRKLKAAAIDGVKTLVIIGFCTLLSWVTALNAVDRNQSEDNTNPEDNISHIEEVSDDERMG